MDNVLPFHYGLFQHVLYVEKGRKE